MGNPITSSQLVKLLVADLREVMENTYNALPTMIPKLYRMIDSESAWDEFYSIGGVPDIPTFTGKLSWLSIAPGYYTRIESKEFAGGLQIERKLLDDKKYPVLDGSAAELMTSAHRVREKYGVRPFAYVFSTAFDFMTSEEGVSLASSSHTTKAGTSTSSGFDNAGTSALSKTSVAATRILMRQFRNDISERIEISDNLGLIVPDNLADIAMEINLTPKGLDTAEGNVNPQYKRYEVIPYLRLDDYNTNDWHMVDMTAMKKYLIWIDRIKPEISNNVDFETFAIQTAVYFRIANGFIGWPWIYSHAVS